MGFLLFLSIQQFIFPELHAQSVSGSEINDKVVILNFDDGRKTQFTEAKPILDKYGFKATFYVVCTYIGAKVGYMNWQEVETLHREGHDIASHGMHHIHLDKLPKVYLTNCRKVYLVKPFLNRKCVRWNLTQPAKRCQKLNLR